MTFTDVVVSLAFYSFAILAVVGGVGVIRARRVVHSALFLVVSLASVAVLYILLSADFLFAVQVLIYVGAIMILMLFAIMLTPQQVEALARVIAWCADVYGWKTIERQVTLWEHREMTRFGSPATACPSGRIPWDTVLALLAQGGDDMPDQRLDERVRYRVIGPGWTVLEKEGALIDFLRDLALGYAWTAKDEAQDTVVRALARAAQAAPRSGTREELLDLLIEALQQLRSRSTGTD